MKITYEKRVDPEGTYHYYETKLRDGNAYYIAIRDYEGFASRKIRPHVREVFTNKEAAL